MRIRIGDGASAAIQLDTGTVQGQQGAWAGDTWRRSLESGCMHWAGEATARSSVVASTVSPVGGGESPQNQWIDSMLWTNPWQQWRGWPSTWEAHHVTFFIPTVEAARLQDSRRVELLEGPAMGTMDALQPHRSYAPLIPDAHQDFTIQQQATLVLATRALGLVEAGLMEGVKVSTLCQKIDRLIWRERIDWGLADAHSIPTMSTSIAINECKGPLSFKPYKLASVTGLGCLQNHGGGRRGHRGGTISVNNPSETSATHGTAISNTRGNRPGELRPHGNHEKRPHRQ